MGNLYSHLPSVNNYEEIQEVPSSTTTTITTSLTPVDQTPAADGSTGQMSKSSLMALIDPRSPTVGVSRTPVEVIEQRERTRLERARRLRYLDVPTLTPTAAGDVGVGDEKLTEAITPTGFIDPRSPTFEYNRTPLALGSDNLNRQVDAAGDVDDMDVQEGTSGKKVYDYEMTVPSNSSQMSRDLRKRLFAAQFNDTPVETQEENKEN